MQCKRNHNNRKISNIRSFGGIRLTRIIFIQQNNDLNKQKVNNREFPETDLEFKLIMILC